MEAMAAKTDGGTYLLGIERTDKGYVGRVELHLSLVPGEDTSDLRNMLGNLYDTFSRVADRRHTREGEGARDMRARLNALITELAQQDEAHQVPASGGKA